MIVKLLTEHHMEFVSLKGGCTGSSESALVKMPLCWKSHVVANFIQSPEAAKQNDNDVNTTLLVHIQSPRRF